MPNRDNNNRSFGFISTGSVDPECDIFGNEWTDKSFERFVSETKTSVGDAIKDVLNSCFRSSAIERILEAAMDAIEEECGDNYENDCPAYEYERDGYRLRSSFDNTVIAVVKSPYFTQCKPCSPCAPGGGDLNNPNNDGQETLCLGHEWFESGVAPYPVFSVETGASVLPSHITKENC